MGNKCFVLISLNFSHFIFITVLIFCIFVIVKNLNLVFMGKSKKTYSKKEELQANRVFYGLLIALGVLGILLIVISNFL